MSAPELAQLRMLAQVDELLSRLNQWAKPDSPWAPINECRALLRRLLDRVETLRIRLESPLVVATFGGTGTGKSALVNALVGTECTTSGRQRPTTCRPALIVHPDTELDVLGLPLNDFDVKRTDSAVLRDLVIIDCPDPDTSEGESAGSNLEILRSVVPLCDVLIYTSTQQKYRSARVLDELAEASTGCRLLFVQTHADVDTDIREDWRNHISGKYEVPEMFFVDSIRALKEQQAGQRPGGDFARLQDLMTTQLAASQRVRIRRANLVDLVHSAIGDCEKRIDRDYPAVQQLRDALDEQRNLLTSTLSRQLGSELRMSRNLWERRLLGAVTDLWGVSPFSSILRFYNGIGGFIASFTFFRARTSAQMALIGAVQGTRWLRGRAKEKEADTKLERIASFGLTDTQLHESQIVIDGFVRSAGLESTSSDMAALDRLRDQAARVEDQFLGDARRRVDGIIDQLAVRHSGKFKRVVYEVLVLSFIAFLLFRIGKNFFWDSFLRPMFVDGAEKLDLLAIDFYVPALLFLLLWSGLLVMMFTMGCRRGLNKEIDRLAGELAESRMSQGLFPDLERNCRTIEDDRARLELLGEATTRFRREIASDSISLGAQTQQRPQPTT